MRGPLHGADLSYGLVNRFAAARQIRKRGARGSAKEVRGSMTQDIAADTQGMQPADLYRIRWLSDARISPGGERVAFVHTTLDEAEDDYRSQIWLADTAG